VWGRLDCRLTDSRGKVPTEDADYIRAALAPTEEVSIADKDIAVEEGSVGHRVAGDPHNAARRVRIPVLNAGLTAGG
jgi:hypothetical protein